MNSLFFEQRTPKEINEDMANRIKGIRKRRKLSQVKLSEKSGVSLGSVKRFEHTGEISLLSLTKIAVALEIESQLCELFSDIPYQSIEEVINAQRR